jgi:prevent-host-death family protein
MLATSAEVQNDFSKYIDLASGQEIIITRDGLPVARLLGVKKSFLTDRLIGIIPNNIDEDAVKAERLARQC